MLSDDCIDTGHTGYFGRLSMGIVSGSSKGLYN